MLRVSHATVQVTDKSLSAHCADDGTCAKDLKVLNSNNAMMLGTTESPQGDGEHGLDSLRRKFFEAYKGDDEMDRVDFFICIHPTSLCELYMPFGRGMIVYATTRFDLGRLHSLQALER